MKYLIPILASVYLVSGCSKAPVMPSDKPALSGSAADADHTADMENHEDHEHGTDDAAAPTQDQAAASPHAADLDLLKTWTKGQYVGGDQLKLSYLPTVPLQ